MSQPGFHIHYEKSRLHVPQPEVFEGYDFDDAFYDYVDCGANAALTIDSYELKMAGMAGTKFVDLFHFSVRMLELLSSLPAEAPEVFRESLPELPPEVKAYSWLFADFLLWMPVVIFATDGAEVRIYTRTWSEYKHGPRLIVMADRDREAPVIVPLVAVIEELRRFVVCCLDDIVVAMPFIANDETYQALRARARHAS